MTSTSRRPRRHDPDRKERIVESALTVLARAGVAGITHRAIAEAADVPLGSITYHFATLDDIVHLAFKTHVERLATRFEDRLSACEPGEDLIECIVLAVTDDLAAHPEELAVTYELYGDAVRRSVTKRITQEWMERAEDALAQHFDRATARLLDVVIEGVMVHMSIAQQPIPTDAVRALLTTAANAGTAAS
ncbi:TetR/AcrR family transcriptional regulator [Mycolicibacterium chlorophenolicum]|uniref:HTH-type transcriptional regulator BetI n=1 Tax=Mycolicibacterium chlorophenolicum TaxID=37916 RepID=A0A0J6YC81_9MYCO|nr:TetR family transcriptional regulator [Mycolicibacterium chlorophenolicum]KMO70406.1 HTH-type transcriptional regulator BetI [Mycolicibacterium chlorophenolicum]